MQWLSFSFFPVLCYFYDSKTAFLKTFMSISANQIGHVIKLSNMSYHNSPSLVFRPLVVSSFPSSRVFFFNHALIVDGDQDSLEQRFSPFSVPCTDYVRTSTPPHLLIENYLKKIHIYISVFQQCESVNLLYPIYLFWIPQIFFLGGGVEEWEKGRETFLLVENCFPRVFAFLFHCCTWWSLNFLLLFTAKQ